MATELAATGTSGLGGVPAGGGCCASFARATGDTPAAALNALTNAASAAPATRTVDVVERCIDELLKRLPRRSSLDWKREGAGHIVVDTRPVPGRTSFFVTAWLILATGVSAAQTFPRPAGRVNDFANIIDAATEAEIDRQLDLRERQTSSEVAVATIPSLGGMSVEEYASRLFKQWGVGLSSSWSLRTIAPCESKWAGDSKASCPMALRDRSFATTSPLASARATMRRHSQRRRARGRGRRETAGADAGTARDVQREWRQ
ncbi:MAG: TPM domain-containing protein [Acidimicrobiia bacterium]|nr:TPM domain-containing protein [Acidimicrobiia bacterium]